MRLVNLLVLIVALATSATWAFPSMMNMEKMNGRFAPNDKRQIRLAMEEASRLADYVRRLEKRQTAEGGPQPVLTPDPNDASHAFQAPGPTDQRGPCPGMNTLANHGYLPRNGIVSLVDLIIGQKEGYNIDYDLGAALAVIAVALDGDLLTTKVSLNGSDSRTLLLGPLQELLSHEGGISNHNSFEGDTSLTRRDFYLNNGDNWSFQGEMYADMQSYAKKFGGPDAVYNATVMAEYRYTRYLESRANNPRFYFSPKAFLLWGASSFVYEAFANATQVTTPNASYAYENSVSSFFGAVADPTAPGGFRHVPERFPENWYRRAQPYNLLNVVGQVGKQYGRHPVQFGANEERQGEHFFFPYPADPSDPNPITIPTSEEDLAGACCALFQLALDFMPAEIASPVLFLQSQLDFLLGSLQPVFKDSCNCANNALTNPSNSTTSDPAAESQLPAAGQAAQAAGSNAVSAARASATAAASS